MKFTFIAFICFLFLSLNGTTIYKEDEQTFPIWNEKCAFDKDSQGCTIISLQKYIYDFEFDGELNNEYLNNKTFIRFYVGFDCKVKNIEVMRSCGDEVFDNLAIQHIAKLPEFYSTGKIGNIECEFPFVIPIIYCCSNF